MKTRVAAEISERTGREAWLPMLAAGRTLQKSRLQGGGSHAGFSAWSLRPGVARRRDWLNVERAMGIEPTALAWEARVLPLYDARRARYFTRIRRLWANRRMR